MDIQGRVALVAGGSSGLGAACARTLNQSGAKVVIADVNKDGGEKLASELGSDARFAHTDVTSEESVQGAVQLATTTFGSLHVAINCAGVGTAERVLGKSGPHSYEHFNKVIRINLIGTFNVIRIAAHTIAQGDPGPEGERGVIVNTASVAAYDGQIGQAAYSASKGGIVGMTLPIARELSRFGIRVMTIAPGIFDTPLLAGLPDAAKASLGQQVPFPPRLGNPPEYAALVAHIIGNDMLNGEVIRLDGALRMAPK